MAVKSFQLPEVLEPMMSYGGLEEMYVCGGFIRDYLIGGAPGKDIDVFVNCTQEQLTDFTRHLSSYGRIEYGQYGSPRYYPSASGEGGYIDIVPFYNFIVADEPVTDLEGLLHNFDFSANALAWDIKREIMYDPENGSSDIKNKILRAIRTDFPEKKVSASIDLSTNTVFWFRLLHFQQRLGFTFDPATEKWIIENRQRFSDLGKFADYFFRPNISDEMKSKLSIDDVY
ncbi:MAG: CCA tRNA nucleotidyltransferase [Bacteroidales bacterium]|nr:CCA tRNA nucleotidyltransferase [Bacteroidales bacterium]